MPHYKLVSFKLCPFVQRSAITLLEKGVAHEIEYIDLSAKPPWFLALSPFGKVPLLVVDHDAALFESAVICEYLDETTPGRRLHPEDPLRRAHNRMWIEFGSALLAEQYRLQLEPTEDGARRQLAAVREKVERLEGELAKRPAAAPGQPEPRWWNGPDFSLVDATLAPFLQRARWAADAVPDFDVIEGFSHVRAWQAALLAHDSVRRSTVADIEALYRDFLRKPLPTNGDRPGYIGSRA
jgi:glutathione S-transferase